MFAVEPLDMATLKVALYETQRKSKLDTGPTNTILSNDCLDNEDVILSCCAGLVCTGPSHGFIVCFFRMSFPSHEQEPQYIDHYLR
jgi:hypothetical protein